jgi:hypothetical protein
MGDSKLLVWLTLGVLNPAMATHQPSRGRTLSTALGPAAHASPTIYGQPSLDNVNLTRRDGPLGGASNLSPGSVDDPELGGTWPCPGTVDGSSGVDGGGCLTSVDPPAGLDGGRERQGAPLHSCGFAAKSSEFAKWSPGLSMGSSNSPPRFPNIVVAFSGNCTTSTPT